MADRVRRCDKCTSMADVTREGKKQITLCSHCGYQTIKTVLERGLGG